MSDGAYKMDELDVSIPAGLVVRYRACIKDTRGLEYKEPLIMVQLMDKKGNLTGWYDGDMIAENVKRYRDSLIERLDKNFIPSNEWEIDHE